ncbi:MAG: DcaP family trimeric outer membrane transporter [Lysobacteraceae bacterium]
MNRKHRKRMLSRAIVVALILAGAPASVLAQAASEREAQLEARVAELERLVQALLEREAAAPPAPAAPTPAPAPAASPPSIVPAAIAGSQFSYGGFIKLDAMLTDTRDGELADSSTGRLMYLPSAIPVGGAGEGVDFDAHAQFSRFWFNVASNTEAGDSLRAYLELDLFGSALGNEAATNTYGLTVRHAFVSWNRWLAGQTWSNFQDVAALPDAVDFIGPTESTVFARQAQVRYSAGPWSFSLENPQTLLTPNLGGAARLSSDDGWLPDLTVRYTHRGESGHVGIAALARQLRYENPASGIDDSATGYGLSVSGKTALGERDDLRWMLSGGRGIGRYIGLAIDSDGVLDGGGDIDASGIVAGFLAWRHVVDPRLRTNLFYSRVELDHDTALSGLGLTRRVHSLHANLIWTPLPKLDLGVEAILGERELESGAEGALRRLHFHAKYSF